MKSLFNMFFKIIIFSSVIFISIPSMAANGGYWGAWYMTSMASFGPYIVCNWERSYNYPSGKPFYYQVKSTKGWWSCPRP